MKKKSHKIFARVLAGGLAGLLLVFGACFAVAYFTQPLSFGGKPLHVMKQRDAGDVLTQTQASGDAAQMVSFLEQVHPMFLKRPPQPYNQNKNKYLLSADKSMTVSEFGALTSRFLTTLEDGHTRVFWVEPEGLAVNWKWVGRTFVIGRGCSLPENAQVISVGGVPVSKIAASVDALFPEENDAGRAAQREEYGRYLPVLQTAGVKNGRDAVVKFSDHGKVTEKTLPFRLNMSADDAPSVEGKRQGGAFVITLRSCDTGAELNKTVASLKRAVSGGVKKVVVDVRDNPGGNSDACLQILNALDMTPGVYGRVIRFSKPASEQNGYLRKSGKMVSEPVDSAKRNPNIKLTVLTNENTFSSAAMLAVWVRDGRLGKIVGQPSSNKPSSYGDIIHFQLNNSRLCGIVSHKQFTRPDITQTDQTELTPDIVVPPDGDALKAALKDAG